MVDLLTSFSSSTFLGVECFSTPYPSSRSFNPRGLAPCLVAFARSNTHWTPPPSTTSCNLHFLSSSFLLRLHDYGLVWLLPARQLASQAAPSNLRHSKSNAWGCYLSQAGLPGPEANKPYMLPPYIVSCSSIVVSMPTIHFLLTTIQAKGPYWWLKPSLDQWLLPSPF